MLGSDFKHSALVKTTPEVVPEPQSVWKSVVGRFRALVGVEKAGREVPCRICGRKMSDPKSIAMGFGPTHLKQNAPAIKMKVDRLLAAKGLDRNGAKKHFGPKKIGGSEHAWPGEPRDTAAKQPARAGGVTGSGQVPFTPAPKKRAPAKKKAADKRPANVKNKIEDLINNGMGDPLNSKGKPEDVGNRAERKMVEDEIAADIPKPAGSMEFDDVFPDFGEVLNNFAREDGKNRAREENHFLDAADVLLKYHNASVSRDHAQKKLDNLMLTDSQKAGVEQYILDVHPMARARLTPDAAERVEFVNSDPDAVVPIALVNISEDFPLTTASVEAMGVFLDEWLGPDGVVIMHNDGNGGGGAVRRFKMMAKERGVRLVEREKMGQEDQVKRLRQDLKNNPQAAAQVVAFRPKGKTIQPKDQNDMIRVWAGMTPVAHGDKNNPAVERQGLVIHPGWQGGSASAHLVIVDRKELAERDKKAKAAALRPGDATPQPIKDGDPLDGDMDHQQAVNALAAGADPMEIRTPDLRRAMKNSGRFEFRPFTQAEGAGISPNEWAIDNSVLGKTPVKIPGAQGKEERRVYMVKGSHPAITNDMLNEVLASAISEGVERKHGGVRERLRHPKTRFAKNIDGPGGNHDGKIIMEHAQYVDDDLVAVAGGTKIGPNDLKASGNGDTMVSLALWDFIINNTRDRHANNQFFTQDKDGKWRVVIIDNGFGFGAAGRDIDTFRDYSQQGRPAGVINKASMAMGRNKDELEKAIDAFIRLYEDIDYDDVTQRMGLENLTPAQRDYINTWLSSSRRKVRHLRENRDSIVALFVRG